MSEVFPPDNGGFPWVSLSCLITSVGRTLLVDEGTMLSGIDFNLSLSLTQVVTLTKV